MLDLEKQHAIWLEYLNKKKIADAYTPSDYNKRNF